MLVGVQLRVPAVRQELKRFQRKGLGYSKDLATQTLSGN